MADQSTIKSKGGRILLLVGAVLMILLPIIAVGVGIAILPRGASFNLPDRVAQAESYGGIGCTKYSGTKLTAYWTPDSWDDYGNRPNVKRMEGGPNDRRGVRNHTLFEYIEGKYVDATKPTQNYVSVAGDATDGSPFAQYGTMVHIPSLEAAYNQGKEIIFKVVDTGEAFKNQRSAKLDIAVSKENQTNLGPLNTTVDIYVGEGCANTLRALKETT